MTTWNLLYGSKAKELLYFLDKEFLARVVPEGRGEKVGGRAETNWRVYSTSTVLKTLWSEVTQDQAE